MKISLIDTLTGVLDIVTKQKFVRYIVHHKFSVIETCSRDAAPSPAHI